MIKKKTNPFSGITQVPYETPLVLFVDKLIEVANKNGSKNYIQTSYDWQTLDFIYRGWCILYPEYARPFEKHMQSVHLHGNKLGISREGEAIIQHQLEIPVSLFQMIKTIFPKQTWDKQFVAKFAKHFPQMRGAVKL